MAGTGAGRGGRGAGGRRAIRIAIDGPAASGKGTVARAVARALGYVYVDTGTLYRAVGLLARRRGLSLDDGPALAELARGMALELRWEPERGELAVLLDGRDETAALRSEEVGGYASRVARQPELRRALLGLQRRLARRGGVVMDGRDIGSVVLPDAELKVYLDASLDERARRRWLELRERGIERPLEAIRTELAERDRQDRERESAPLRRLPEAFYVDTTGLSPEQVTERVLEEARHRGAVSKAP